MTGICPTFFGWCHSHHVLDITPSIYDINSHWHAQSLMPDADAMIIMNYGAIGVWRIRDECMEMLTELRGKLPDATSTLSVLYNISIVE